MEFGQIVAPTIKELFIERIEGMILSGQLKPGERLPSERDLAEQMKISKTIVHIGLEDLARMGFLEVTPRRGTVVAVKPAAGDQIVEIRFEKVGIKKTMANFAPLTKITEE